MTITTMPPKSLLEAIALAEPTKIAGGAGRGNGKGVVTKLEQLLMFLPSVKVMLDCM